jgi:UDPglucose 6-dehydrogenase
MKIGILGVGFVGGTHLKAFELARMTVKTHDIKHEGSKIENLLDCELVFVGLPSPTEYGRQNLEIMERSFEEMKALSFEGVLCIKSTVMPGTTNKFRSKYNLRIVHSPEFLRERCALDDFLFQTTILVGGPSSDTSIVVEAYQKQRSRMKQSPLKLSCHKDPCVTEMAKYMHNSFLATKVAWANQFADICQKAGVPYDVVCEATKTQGGLGLGHLSVPGPDGKRGFSGTCFPKDTLSLITEYPEMTILAAAREYNETIRRHDEFCRPLV